MICEKCKEEGLESNIQVGISSETLMYTPPYFDKEGEYHNHNMNWSTTNYRCSNGHGFYIQSKMGCRPCGIRAIREVVYEER